MKSTYYKPFVRSASIADIIRVLYFTIVIAWLVGLYVTQDIEGELSESR